MIVGRVGGQVQVLQEVVGGPCQKLVEDVEVSLSFLLVDNSRLFQEVVEDVAAQWIALRAGEVKLNLRQLWENKTSQREIKVCDVVIKR